MVALNTPHQQNGMMVHYYENENVPCHPAIVSGNAVSVDGYPTAVDIIQLDNVENGAIVPLKREDVPWDETYVEGVFSPANSTVHNIGCMRAPTAIEI